MPDQKTQKLSELLDKLESSVQGESIKVENIVETLGEKSFAALMLAFSLISTSPASAIPGVTAVVAGIVFILSIQMIFGREHVWLPQFITGRNLSSEKICKGIGWIRRPVELIERLLRPRLTFLCHRPWLLVPLLLTLGLTLLMPFMEIIPTSGSIASAAIALFSAGLLTRDGGLIAISLIPLLIVPVLIYRVGFAG
ncbi:MULTISPECIES: exopolysaccharide biosynthesis protein [unclassified Salipiger]|uniref:exopolysaccharide biosynthesis protein n=1 Tax=unclassified Salipiger TaxID=2640570 RepID=UPI0013B7F2FF|nr:MULTISPECIES: exopolysaccharide biosynthesis protein [unclassified Salipiger]NDV49306.1 exopolysaccharide biosynthesis protein [Salipiger sp. PrR003]NDW32778.1 exopolysaccharide biosynthesis protein [Salipiger sp. PrR007]